MTTTQLKRADGAGPLVLLLAVLFLGPLLAPLLQATRLPPLADTGALARDLLAAYVCPTPAKSYALAGHPMAVCARCWGATIGLWLAYALIRRARGAYLGLPWPVRLGLAALPLLLWPLEIARWPAAPLAVLLLNGVLGGALAGLPLCSAWLKREGSVTTPR